MDRPIVEKKNLFKKKSVLAMFTTVFVFSFFYYLNSNVGIERISRENIRVATVKQGLFTVEVLGTGTLVPKSVEWIMPITSGEVTSVSVRAGDAVKKGQVLFKLSNTDLLNDMMESKSKLKELKAAISSRKFDLFVQEMDYELKSQDAKFDFEYLNELFQAQHELLGKKNSPISAITYSQTKIRLKQLKFKSQLAERKLHNFKDIMQTRILELRVRVDSAEEDYRRIEKIYQSLEFLAAKAGVIQDFDLEIGRLVNKGELVAQIVNPNEVYVRLKVPAYRAIDIALGQKVTLNINRNTVYGVVERIDPNVKGSTVSVDVELNNPLGGAKIGMQASGKILIREIDNTLFVERPDNARTDSKIGVYRIDSNERAKLVFISMGELSEKYVQILQGVDVNDQLILSDMNKFDPSQEIQVN